MGTRLLPAAALPRLLLPGGRACDPRCIEALRRTSPIRPCRLGGSLGWCWRLWVSALLDLPVVPVRPGLQRFQLRGLDSTSLDARRHPACRFPALGYPSRLLLICFAWSNISIKLDLTVLAGTSTNQYKFKSLYLSTAYLYLARQQI